MNPRSGFLKLSVPSATAILDRFLHHAEIIQHHRQQLPAAESGRSESGAEPGIPESEISDIETGRLSGDRENAKTNSRTVASTEENQQDNRSHHVHRLVLKRPSLAGFKAPNDRGAGKR